MDESQSDSESDFYESAEENQDENEDEGKTSGDDSKRRNENKLELEKPAVRESESSCSDNPLEDRKSMAYRKRPEKTKHLSSKSFTKTVTKSRQTHFKADGTASDKFLMGISSNLTKNFNRSLNSIQQTSSSMKGLFMSSHPVTGSKQNEEFSYDDEKFDLPSFENNRLSDETFSPSSPSIEMSSKISESRSGPDSDVNAKKVVKSTSENEMYKVKADFGSSLGDQKLIKKKTKLFDCDLEKKLNIPEIGESLTSSNATDLPDKSNINSAKEKCVTSVEKTNQSVERTFNDVHLIEDHKLDKHILDVPSKKCSGDRNSQVKTNLDGFSKETKKKKDDKETEYLVSSSMQDLNSKKSSNATQEKETIEEVKESNVKPDSEMESLSADSANEKNSCEARDGWSDFDYRNSETDELAMNASAFPKADEWKNGSVEVAEKLHADTSETTLVAGETKTTNQNVFEVGNEIQSRSVKASEEEEKIAKATMTTPKPKDQPEKVEVEKNEPSDWEWDEWADDENTKATKSNNTEDSEGNKNDWDWDDWGDDDDATGKTNVGIQPKQEANPTEKDRWSGWDAFSQKMEEKQSNLWGSWGVNMLLDKATAVTQGISSALEAGLGAPDPETLARMEKAERESIKEEKNEREAKEKVKETASEELNLKNSLADGKLFSALVGVTSKIVENSKIQEIGSRVLSGGLDTLESFGKKTMEVLQEGDPGLKNKRALFLGSDKSVLSQVLREIKEKTEMEMREMEQKEINRKCHFEGLFDDYKGLVHLEALEMLSTQCDLKLEQIRIPMSPEEQVDLNGVLEEVEQLCSMDDYDLHETSNNGRSFREALEGVVKPFKEDISIVKILEIRNDADKWLQSPVSNKISTRAVHQKLVSTLAQLTAAVIHQYHKVAELLCIKECRKTVEEIDVLSEMTQILILEINRISDGFVNLSKRSFKENEESLGPLINQIDSVRNTSTSFIKQAFNLLIPILQIGAAM